MKQFLQEDDDQMLPADLFPARSPTTQPSYTSPNVESDNFGGLEVSKYKEPISLSLKESKFSDNDRRDLPDIHKCGSSSRSLPPECTI